MVTTRKRGIPAPLPPVGRLWSGTIRRCPPAPRSESLATAGWDLSAMQGIQITESINHPEWRSSYKKGTFTGDVGGNFSSVRRYATVSTPSVTLVNTKNVDMCSDIWARYEGPLLPYHPSLTLGFPPFSRSSNSELDAFGTTAIARCKPTNSVADASVFLGEFLREGLPKQIGAAAKRWLDGTTTARKAAGSEYLNVEFGWKPIVNDVRKFSHAIVDAHSILAQYQRDSGRLVRRRYEFPPVVKTEVSTFVSDVSPFYSPSISTLRDSALSNKGKVIRVRETTIRRWFSGAFTYYIPAAYDRDNMMARDILNAKKLLGLSLTPDTLWNLAPWSWAIDWVTNAGDVVSNLTDWAFDGLVLKYGYIMEHSLVKDTYTFVGPTGLIPPSQRPSDLVFSSESKIRRKATPFGFGLNWGDFSPRQIAIAIALGLTRS